MTVQRGERVGEGIVELDGRWHYVVTAVERMPPFLMSVVSDGDRWMFVSSTGALTAGRVDASRALFPYETDDRLHAAGGAVGPVTRVRILPDGAGATVGCWRPFTDPHDGAVHRRLAKTLLGESVCFEEHHEALGLRLRSRWDSTEPHGFVRTATLANDGPAPVRLTLLDGLLGVVPHGIDPALDQRFRNLTNAYKRSELLPGPGRLAVLSLEAPVSDRAEPAEVLRATVVWSHGLDGAEVLLDGAAVRAIDAGEDLPPRPVVTGRPGAYLLRTQLALEPGASVSWRIVADVARDQLDVVALRRRLGSDRPPHLELDEAIAATGTRLERIVAGADAAQRTGDAVASAHHLANVVNNVLRGGVPLSGYLVDPADVADFVATRNRRVAARHAAWLEALPTPVDRRELLRRAAEQGDVHLERLALEYLPFSFSRRHGDPSRPWNAFSIRVADDQGRPVIRYEGNWRDVFQNWEALCASYPEYLPGVVAVFASASTPDGHNPYRISRDGIDWEVPDPDDPWSNIGYWGDHQVVYLLRLLEATERYLPGELARHLDEPRCTYADVPYRIADHHELVRRPKAAIRFDADADARSRARVESTGGDGRLVPGPDGEPLVVTLLEKLVVTALAKLSNLVPAGGIWMSTQRPEWNDANNALAGHGLSMVTLCHLRELLVHLRGLAIVGDRDAELSVEVAAWLTDVRDVLAAAPADVPDDELDRHRRQVMDALGAAASRYRSVVYRSGLSGTTVAVPRRAVAELCDAALPHLDTAVRRSRRPDGLVHSYRLLELDPEGTTARVLDLPVMLEGQVAVLGSGVLGPSEQADVIDALVASSLHRPDLDTFLLAPVRSLPSFLEKNAVPPDEVRANPLLAALVEADERSVLRCDVEGRYRFHADLTDVAALATALDRLGEREPWRELVAAHRRAVVEIYERVFEHHAHLGRSGTMYAYEGIGSVYWHMVAKLLVALQRAVCVAADDGGDPRALERLRAAYWRVRSGLGFNRSAHEFGAIPTDPYSHSPAHAGAQQPGMTGAVKEELLTRPLELGVRVVDGELVFDPLLLRPCELLDAPSSWTVTEVGGGSTVLDLAPGSLGLTVCQVPVVIARTDGDSRIEVHRVSGEREVVTGTRLGRERSAEVFGRTGRIRRIEVRLPIEPG